MVTCVNDAMFPDTGKAVVRLLRRLGVEVDFPAAQTAFGEFVRRYPQSGYRNTALFWLGNAQYANRDYRGAIGNFRALLAQAPEHARAPEALLSIARDVLPSIAPKVRIEAGRLRDGLPGPWDVIMIEGAVSEIPATIGATLNHQGGRLVTVVARDGGLGKGVLAEPINPGSPQVILRAQPQFDCATPLLPAFMAAPAFQF